MSKPASTIAITTTITTTKTPFQRVAEMNVAFGNPKGDYRNIDWNRVRNQCKNIFDEYCELLAALGANPIDIAVLRMTHIKVGWMEDAPNVMEVRDALADIQVFKDGALHMMGIDGDADMHAVVDGVMTRFIKDEDDLQATIAYHAKRGVSDVYFEGEFPKLVMKSASDQPDAPKGKFLKSVSYQNTVFPAVK